MKYFLYVHERQKRSTRFTQKRNLLCMSLSSDRGYAVMTCDEHTL